MRISKILELCCETVDLLRLNSLNKYLYYEMADVDEIIDYIKSLKKGFDKDLFQSKINELAYSVDVIGLDYKDFHTLFKVWLNLSLPITKWVNLGSCLVPQDEVEERTVEYALCWILANYEDQSTFARLGFLLDWLTAAMECNAIDMSLLDTGYDVFYISLSYESLTPHAMKLVYTLTKPIDVTRRRVLELLDYSKKRETKKNMYRQLQVLLGLFKSYKPECVPEDVPAISIHTAFKKLNPDLLARFKRNQERRNITKKQKHQLFWINPVNSKSGKNRKAEPLVPNMEFLNIGSKQYGGKEKQDNYLDFSDPAALLRQCAARPARLRALLCNAGGLALLALAQPAEHAFLAHDLYRLLNNCFLEISEHSQAEKRDLLHRLAVLQHTLLQGVPVVTRFLAQYLPFWNEMDYFAEILELVEWVSVDSPDHVTYIVETLGKVYQRAQPMQQCAILKSLTNMYANLVYSSTKKYQHFMGMQPSPSSYALLLPKVAASISDMCNKALQVDPEDIRVVYSSVWAAVGACWAALAARAGAAALRPPPPLAMTLPLLHVSATVIEMTTVLMRLYKHIFKQKKSLNTHPDEGSQMKLMQMLASYTSDLTNCLCTDEALSSRKSGLVFDKLHPQMVSQLSSIMPDVDSKLSIKNHLAFAPYTYLQLGTEGYRDADNKLCFHVAIEQEFKNLALVLKKAVPELNQSLNDMDI